MPWAFLKGNKKVNFSMLLQYNAEESTEVTEVFISENEANYPKI